MEKTIFLWIKNLIEDGKFPTELVDKNFYLEDGMDLQEYWDYEKKSFQKYTKIFDLNSNFSIEIYNREKIEKNKTLCYVYVINNLGKIAFKMTITINDENKISSNNFLSQIVPKYVIENNEITKIGIAIKPQKNLKLENIISTNLEKISFGISESFYEDYFYNAQFLLEEKVRNKCFVFYLKYEGIEKKEKRSVFFDQFKIENCPYILEEKTISIRDDAYPVNLVVYYKNEKIMNYAYPRGITESLINVKKVIVTDVLDNDWVLSLNDG